MQRISCASALIFVAGLTVSACGDMQAAGFSLPPGDEATGSKVFVEMACNHCHSVVGREDLRPAGAPSMDVPLGGPSERIHTYGELVTSVINPSHRISESLQVEPFTVDGVSGMMNYNDVLTVTQLVNLVTFLEAQYELVAPPQTEYVPYEYP